MPVGPYETFDKCVAAQKKKGKSDESARKICGAIEQNMKKGHSAASAETIAETEEYFTNLNK